MITPAAGATTLKPGSATFPLPGIDAEVVDEAGDRVDKGRRLPDAHPPWPRMMRGIYGDPERYQDTYWTRFGGRYFAGDGCKVDDDGYLWLLGRVDDVMNVSGHRISTTEVESRARRPPGGRRGGRRRRQRRRDRRGHRRLRDARGIDADQRSARSSAATWPRRSARPPAPSSDLHRRAAQDPLGQDHAPSAARRRRGPRARRHHHAGRPDRRRRDPQAGPGPTPRGLIGGRAGRAHPRGRARATPPPSAPCGSGPPWWDTRASPRPTCRRRHLSCSPSAGARPSPRRATTRSSSWRATRVPTGRWSARSRPPPTPTRPAGPSCCASTSTPGTGVGASAGGCTTPALGHLQHAGYRVVVLWVLERNVRARAMYERWWTRHTGAPDRLPGRHRGLLPADAVTGRNGVGSRRSRGEAGRRGAVPVRRRTARFTPWPCT